MNYIIRISGDGHIPCVVSISSDLETVTEVAQYILRYIKTKRVEACLITREDVINKFSKTLDEYYQIEIGSPMNENLTEILRTAIDEANRAETRVSFAEPNFFANLHQKFLKEFPEYEQPAHKCFVDDPIGDDDCAKENGGTCFYADAHNFTTKENCKHWKAPEKYELTYYPCSIWEWFEKQMSNREARSN